MRRLLLIFSLLSLTLQSVMAKKVKAEEVNIISVPLKIHESNSTLGILTSRIIFLADQLFRNKSTFLDRPIIITSFQNLDNFTEVNQLGRLIAEALIHEMHIRNLKVLDFRFQDKIKISESGEFVLSRNPKDLKSEMRAGFILTGTYSIIGNGYFINARVIDIDTSLVVSSGQILIPLNQAPASKIRIVGGPQ